MTDAEAKISATGAAASGRWLVAACFFFSGLGSLALEVVWTRELRLIFGSTTLAASTILVAYMLGLGAGGLAGGRLAARLRDGVRAYGWLEVAIGLYALAVPWLLALLPALRAGLLADLSFWPAALCRFLIALGLLLLPTLLMGATLPIMVEALVRRDARVAGSTGLLYGLNTLGAVAGVFAATFVAFPLLGLAGTNRVAALLDVAVGLFALTVVARRVGAAPGSASTAAQRPARAPAPGEPLPAWLLLPAYATVGFSALLYEVAWTRALSVVMGSSIYAFAAMLGAFLAGIGLGSLVFRRWIERSARPQALLVAGMAALAALGLSTTLSLPHLPAVLLAWIESGGVSSSRLALAQVGLSMLAMLPTTLVLGGLFPLVTRLAAEGSRDAGSAVGRVYFANTIGSAAGAFCTGFVLIPGLGLRTTLAVGGALNLAAAAALLLALPRGGRRRGARPLALAAAGSAALLLVLPLPFDRMALTRGVFRSPEAILDFGVPDPQVEGLAAPELLYYRDGLNTTVSVERDGGVIALRVNGKIDASSFGDMPTQVLLGELPLLFGPPAEKVLVIGYASGVTVGSVARHTGVERIDAVEIEPAIIEASRFFDEQSGAPLDDPRVRVVLDDARSLLAATREKYDVIISEPSNPWMSGVANLFTREFFAVARDALAPGGRLLQWVQLYALEPEALYSILAALETEFGHVYGFAHSHGNADLLLLATDRPLGRGDLPRWEELSDAVQADLERIGIFSTEDLWSLLVLLPGDVAELAARARIVNGDDNLHIELGTPWMLYEQTVPRNWDAFDEVAPRGVLPLLRASGEPLDAERIGALALSYAQRRQSPDVATELLRAAGARGRAAHSIAAAVLVARGLNVRGGLPLEQQLASLDEAVTLAPHASEVLLLRGRLALEGGRYAAALADADALLARRPDDARAAALRVRSLAGLERWDEARAALEPLLGSPLEQYDPELVQEAARLDLFTGRVREGVDGLERYLRRDNWNWAEGWALLAEGYRALGRTEEADAARRNGERATTNQALLLHRRARAALWRDDVATAAGLLDAVLTLDPANEAARRDLAAISARPGA